MKYCILILLIFISASVSKFIRNSSTKLGINLLYLGYDFLTSAMLLQQTILVLSHYVLYTVFILLHKISNFKLIISVKLCQYLLELHSFD